MLVAKNDEITTLPSVARSDIALLDANVYYPLARDDKFLKKNYEYKNHKLGCDI